MAYYVIAKILQIAVYSIVHFSVSSVTNELVCSCNDNSHCVLTPSSLSKPTPSSHIGNCTVHHEGKCYTARVIDQDLIRDFLFVHESLRQNNSISPTLKNVIFSTDRYTIENFVHTRYGCFLSHEKVTLACNSHLSMHAVPSAIECCDSSNFCNSGLYPKFVHYKSDQDALYAAVEYLGKSKAKFSNQVHEPSIYINQELLQSDLIRSEHEEEDYSHGDDTKYTNVLPYPPYVLMVVACIVVVVILCTVLLFVYILYKRRLRKNWQFLSTVGHLQGTAFKSSMDLATLSETKYLNNWFLKNNDATQVSLQRHVPSKVKSDPSSQTLSTDVTRNADNLSANKTHYLVTMAKGVSQNLVLQTVSKQVTLSHLLGRGRFSDIWSATWRGETVIAKVFLSNHPLSHSNWRRTVHLHRTMLLRHQTIHGLMAVDWLTYPTSSHMLALNKLGPHMIPLYPSPCALLIGELCAYGTLKDLLVNKVDYLYDPNAPANRFTNASGSDKLKLCVILQLVNSFVQGLCFLHSEFAGTRGKPALAHRNLKPSNVYIRSDWSCCISDLGFAVRSPPSQLPLSVNQLNTLYQAYLDGNRNPLQTDGVSTDQTTNEFPIRKDALCDEFEVPRFDYRQETVLDEYLTAINGDQLQPDKLELLDWWPVGGPTVGSSRYMAPELLNNSINPFCFGSHQKADIYAMSLILWEILHWSLSDTHWFNHTSAVNRHHESDYSTESLNNNNNNAIIRITNLNQSFYVNKSGCGLPAYQTQLADYFAENYKHNKQMNCSSADLHKQNVSVAAVDKLENRLPHSENAHIEHNFKFENTDYEPDLDVMRQLVCVLQRRPILPKSFNPSSVHPILGFSSHNYNTEKRMNQISLPALSGTENDLSPTHKLSLLDASSNHQQQFTNSVADLMEIYKLQNLVATHFATLLPECWSNDADARLTVLRVKKSLDRLREQMEQICSFSL